MSLKGKTLFISGASRGIGLAIGLRAARDGANVAIAAKTAEPNPKLPGTIYTAAKDIENAGGKALPVLCDIRFEEQVQNAIEQTVAKFGGIDICVNNASAISLTGTLQTDMKRYDLMNGINARGAQTDRQADTARGAGDKQCFSLERHDRFLSVSKRQPREACQISIVCATVAAATRLSPRPPIPSHRHGGK